MKETRKQGNKETRNKFPIPYALWQETLEKAQNRYPMPSGIRCENKNPLHSIRSLQATKTHALLPYNSGQHIHIWYMHIRIQPNCEPYRKSNKIPPMRAVWLNGLNVTPVCPTQASFPQHDEDCFPYRPVLRDSKQETPEVLAYPSWILLGQVWGWP